MTGKNLIPFGVRVFETPSVLERLQLGGGYTNRGGGGQCVLDRARGCDIFLFQKNGEKVEAVQTERCVGDP